MINLINTLMHQQHRLIIGRQQKRRKRSLPEAHCAPLDLETFLNRGVDLGFTWGCAGWEEGGDEGSGGV
jgi:hypothetical protein